MQWLSLLRSGYMPNDVTLGDLLERRALQSLIQESTWQTCYFCQDNYFHRMFRWKLVKAQLWIELTFNGDWFEPLNQSVLHVIITAMGIKGFPGLAFSFSRRYLCISTCGSMRECEGVSAERYGSEHGYAQEWARIHAGVSSDRHGSKCINWQENEKTAGSLTAWHQL